MYAYIRLPKGSILGVKEDKPKDCLFVTGVVELETFDTKMKPLILSQRNTGGSQLQLSC